MKELTKAEAQEEVVRLINEWWSRYQVTEESECFTQLARDVCAVIASMEDPLDQYVEGVCMGIDVERENTEKASRE